MTSISDYGVSITQGQITTDSVLLLDRKNGATFQSGKLEVGALTNYLGGVLPKGVPSITYSTLTITVGAFTVLDFNYSGGTLTIAPNQTGYLCVNLRSKALHLLQRNFDQGVVYLGQVTANTTAITSIQQIQPVLPSCKIPRTMAKLQQAQPLRIGLIGSSLVENGATIPGWQHLIFNPSYYYNSGNITGGASGTTPGSNYFVNALPAQSIVSGYSSDFASLSGWAGTPTGTTQVPGAGPNGENALQWSGGGRLYTDLSGNGNQLYNFTVQAKVVSGTPSVTIYLKDNVNETIRGQSKLTLNTTAGVWNNLNIAGYTAGTTAGVRAEITVSGGTVQLTNAILKPSNGGDSITGYFESWGNPTAGFTYGFNGPNGEPSCRWDGSSGGFYKDFPFPFNTQFWFSLQARAISGSLTVTIWMSAYGKSFTGTGYFNQSTGITPTSNWQTIGVFGNPALVYASNQGSQPGFRVEIIVSGTGVVEFTRPHSSYMPYTAYNYGVGGSNSRYAASLLGTLVTSKGNGNADRSGTVVESMNPQHFNLSPAATNSYSQAYNLDLAIVGLLPNGGTDRLPAYEGVVRMLRSRGVEVLLVTDNAQGTSFGSSNSNVANQKTATLWVDGPFVNRLAKQYGCALADTAAYMREQEILGNSSIYMDSIHPSLLSGQPLWAESIAGVVSHSLNLPSTREDFQLQFASPLDSTSPIPGRIDVEFTPSYTGGTTGTSSDLQRRPWDIYGYLNQQTIVLTTGNTLTLAHPLMLSCDLIHSSDSSWGASVTNNGSVLKNISYSGSNFLYRPASTEVLTAANIVGIKSKSVVLTITSGTLTLYSVTYHCPAYVQSSQLIQTDRGTIAKETSVFSNMNHYWTDTTNDLIYSRFHGRSIAVIYGSNTGGGQSTQYFDGVSQGTLDLYSATATTNMRILGAGSPYQEHQFAVQYSGTNNASATATSAGNRRLPVIQTFSILDR